VSGHHEPNRRTLLTGAAAVGAVATGGAVIAPAVAAPDAELLQLAAELRAAEEAWRAAACRTDDPDDAGAEDDAEAASETVEGLLQRMAATPACGPSGIATPACGPSGIAAKAGRLTYSLSDTGTIMYAEMPLAASLAADLARLMPQTVAPVAAAIRPDPDAALEEIADAMVAGQAEAQRLMEPYGDVVGFEYPPETEARLRALTGEYHTLRKQLAAMPATGPAGHRAKARGAMLWLEPGGPEDAPEPDCDEHLAWSLCRGLLA
jgi:hypothetical protein